MTSSDFISFGSWDSQRKGLLAGERLALDLRRSEVAFLEQNARKLEITKNVSLLQLDPRALVTLRAPGVCQFTLPEAFFDLDYPGQYFRRIKSVIISVLGPLPRVGTKGRSERNVSRHAEGAEVDRTARVAWTPQLVTDRS